MKKLSLIFTSLVLVSVLGTGCATKKTNLDQTHMVAATNWIQNAAEVRALYYQAFNIAKQRLEADIKWSKSQKKRAVVVDVDETIVDNSPYQAKNILNNETYNSKSWGKWVDEARAEALPGALEFLKYAAENDVAVFYVTNRKVRGFDATYKNLKALGFPVEKDKMLLRDKDRSKTSRRAKVLKNHRIVLLMGDNLDDFDDIFENKSVKDRFKVTDKMKSRFGKKFIVLPNPMYGTWEGAIHGYNMRKAAEVKHKERMEALKE